MSVLPVERVVLEGLEIGVVVNIFEVVLLDILGTLNLIQRLDLGYHPRSLDTS